MKEETNNNDEPKKVRNEFKYQFYVDKDGDLAMRPLNFKDIPPMKCELKVKQLSYHEFGFKMY